jgi:hypothetical protein
MKVIQWHVDNIKEPGTNNHISNYFPWRRLEAGESLEKIVRELRSKKNSLNFGRFSFVGEEPCNSWVAHANETEIRYIRKDSASYDKKDINIFPIRILANEDDVFVHPHLCPFANLPEDIIIWLESHPSCAIVFHDPHEAKAITDELFATIPALTVKRKQYNLLNQFVWLDSRAATDKLKENSYYTLPNWLHFAAQSHWLQMTGQTVAKETIELIKKRSKKTPLFDEGRFMMYAGRFRPGRYYLAKQFLENIPEKQLWLSLNKPVLDSEPKTIIKSVVDFNNLTDKKRGLASLFFPSDIEEMQRLYESAPINTFPERLKEENDVYQHLKYFWLPNPYHYSDAFIDISTETYNERSGVYYNELFLTEKICKPLWAGRPFIMSANPGTYKLLKEYKFETFDKWWDESFDNECDFKTHADKILRVIKKISKMSYLECYDMYQDMLPTLRHNQELIEYYTFRAPRFWITELKRLRNLRFI